MKYAGIDINPQFRLDDDPEYMKMVAVGRAIAKFQREEAKTDYEERVANWMESANARQKV